MAVYLCGASIDENGRATGGKAGDQTGREVRRIAWYLYGGAAWSYVIRLDDAAAAEKLATAAEQGAANNNIGYDQSNRNDLFLKIRNGAKMGNVALTETDCTAFAATCAFVAGASGSVLFDGNNLPYSGNFDSKLLKACKCKKLTASKYLNNSNYLKRGDILVKAGHHAEVVVSNGAKADAPAPKPEPKPEPVICCIQAAYNGTDAQRWQVVPVGGGFVKIVNASGLCLDVTGGSTKAVKDGRTVSLHKDNGTDAQRWKLIDCLDSVMIASALNEDFVLDNSGGTVGARSYVRLYHRQTKPANQWAQCWHLLNAFDGSTAIVNAKSLYALDSNPTNIQL